MKPSRGGGRVEGTLVARDQGIQALTDPISPQMAVTDGNATQPALAGIYRNEKKAFNFLW
jgi:hypothetical protein